MDFSEAQQVGFISAFEEFWSRRPGDGRTKDELCTAAKLLLKGCKQHYQSGVTRVKKIGAVVQGRPDLFASLANELLSEGIDLKAFNKLTDNIFKEFPAANDWLEWWLRDSHAPAIFPARRIMGKSVWDSIPATTNAEEAMHNKIYHGVGQKHTLMDGLRALVKFCDHYKRLYEGAESEPIPFELIVLYLYSFSGCAFWLWS